MIKLEELTSRELEERVRQRLSGRLAGGPAVDPRLGHLYDWLVESYQHGSDGFQRRFTSVLRDLVEELLNESAAWDAAGERNLFAVVQRCGEQMVGDLRRWSKDYEPHDLRGRRRLAHMLKCLMNLRQRGSLPFWFDQYRKLGKDHGAFVFRGLLEHKLEIAVRYLPAFCESDATRAQIEGLLPALVNRFGYERVEKSLHQLSGPLRESLESELVRLQETAHPAPPNAPRPPRKKAPEDELAEKLFQHAPRVPTHRHRRRVGQGSSGG